MGLSICSSLPRLQDPEKLLSMFQFMAHHGLKLSTTTEHRVEQILASLAVRCLPGRTLARLARHFDRASCGGCASCHALAWRAHVIVAGTEAD